MPPRLLSLLSLIEAALSGSVQGGVVMRSANYPEGIARMTFADGGGSIVLRNFLLADGELCVRVDLRRAGTAGAGASVIYPRTGAFDWTTAAAKIARAWCVLAPVADDGKPEAET